MRSGLRFDLTAERPNPHGGHYDRSYEVRFRTSENLAGYVNRDDRSNVGEYGGDAVDWIAEGVDGRYLGAAETRKEAAELIEARWLQTNKQEGI